MFLLRKPSRARAARALVSRRLSVLSSLLNRGAAATHKGTTHTIRSEAPPGDESQAEVPLCAIDTLQPYDLRLSLFFEPQPPLQAELGARDEPSTLGPLAPALLQRSLARTLQEFPALQGRVEVSDASKSPHSEGGEGRQQAFITVQGTSENGGTSNTDGDGGGDECVGVSFEVDVADAPLLPCTRQPRTATIVGADAPPLGRESPFGHGTASGIGAVDSRVLLSGRCAPLRVRLLRSPTRREWATTGRGAHPTETNDWVQGGTALSVSLSHAVGDQRSLVQFVQQWARQHREMLGVTAAAGDRAGATATAPAADDSSSNCAQAEARQGGDSGLNESPGKQARRPSGRARRAARARERMSSSSVGNSGAAGGAAATALASDVGGDGTCDVSGLGRFDRGPLLRAVAAGAEAPRSEAKDDTAFDMSTVTTLAEQGMVAVARRVLGFVWQSSYGGFTRLQWRLRAADVQELVATVPKAGENSETEDHVDTVSLAVASHVWRAIRFAEGGDGASMSSPSPRLLLARCGRGALGLGSSYFGNVPAGVQVSWADVHGSSGDGLPTTAAIASAIRAACSATGSGQTRAQLAWLLRNAPPSPLNAMAGGQLNINLFGADAIVESWLHPPDAPHIGSLRFGGAGAGVSDLHVSMTLGTGVPVLPRVASILPVPCVVPGAGAGGGAGAVDVLLNLPTDAARQLTSDEGKAFLATM